VCASFNGKGRGLKCYVIFEGEVRKCQTRYVKGERVLGQTGDEEVESAAHYEDLGSTRAQKVGQQALERLLESNQIYSSRKLAICCFKQLRRELPGTGLTIPGIR
jgi:hypothetical protein